MYVNTHKNSNKTTAFSTMAECLDGHMAFKNPILKTFVVHGLNWGLQVETATSQKTCYQHQVIENLSLLADKLAIEYKSLNKQYHPTGTLT